MKLKTMYELRELINNSNNDKAIIDYIDTLHKQLLNYQTLIDQLRFNIDSHNKNVEL